MTDTDFVRHALEEILKEVDQLEDDLAPFQRNILQKGVVYWAKAALKELEAPSPVSRLVIRIDGATIYAAHGEAEFREITLD